MIDPIIGAAAISSASSLIGGGISAAGARSANRATKAASAQQVAFEREKANNAHQWEVNDLMKAGMNPALTASGQGAQAGSMTLPNYINEAEGQGEAFRSAGAELSRSVTAAKQLELEKGRLANLKKIQDLTYEIMKNKKEWEDSKEYKDYERRIRTATLNSAESAAKIADWQAEATTALNPKVAMLKNLIREAISSGKDVAQIYATFTTKGLGYGLTQQATKDIISETISESGRSMLKRNNY